MSTFQKERTELKAQQVLNIKYNCEKLCFCPSCSNFVCACTVGVGGRDCQRESHHPKWLLEERGVEESFFGFLDGLIIITAIIFLCYWNFQFLKLHKISIWNVLCQVLQTNITNYEYRLCNQLALVPKLFLGHTVQTWAINFSALMT